MSLDQNNLALVALLVSLVALLTTVLQVLQQYFSSAEGYRRCTVGPLLLRLPSAFLWNFCAIERFKYYFYTT
jgi:hypothetical protein